jgi:hypothetical protein
MYRSFINAARNQEDADVGARVFWLSAGYYEGLIVKCIFSCCLKKGKGTFKGRGEEN